VIAPTWLLSTESCSVSGAQEQSEATMSNVVICGLGARDPQDPLGATSARIARPSIVNALQRMVGMPSS
jgi:hypothetical protein